MIYGNERTQSLGDRGYAPRESLPFVYALCMSDRFHTASGRKTLRKLLGPEHEKSNMNIPGMRGFPVWRYVLRGETVEPAPVGVDADGLPTVYILGPANKKFFTSVEAPITTTGPQAAVIMAHVAELLDVDPIDPDA